MWCDDEYAPDHKCNQNKLFLVVVNEVEEEEDPPNEINVVVKLEKENPFMIVHTMSGVAANEYKTMSHNVYVKKKHLQILIDSGRTYNFLDNGVVKRLEYKIDKAGLFIVKITDKNSLACTTMIRE